MTFFFRACVVALCLFQVDFWLGRDWQVAGTENKRPVVRCGRKGRFSGRLYGAYTCSRGNDVWTPVPYNPPKQRVKEAE